MLANLKIIWQFHAHYIQCIKKSFKCRDFLGRDISGMTFFRAESSLIQSNCRSLRNLKSYNFRVETNILVSMSEAI
jgi:hypothetical protein